MENILVTGGAGYIGSITIEKLLEQGHKVIVLDNLSEGHKAALPADIPFYNNNVGDQPALNKIFSEHNISTVVHFAALALVGESMNDPEGYYENNVAQTNIMLDKMKEYKIPKFIFSSSCAIFGEPAKNPITEDLAKKPINPYGETKLEVEKELLKRQQEYGLKFCALRYFNAAGASLKHGEDRRLETHLIPLVLDTALGKRENISIFGTDYPTPDGSCVRAYIHVFALAAAHIAGIKYLENNDHGYFNLGNGKGYSVKEVIETARLITGHPLPAIEEARRPGDPATLVGSSALAIKELDWQPKLPELAKIIESAWNWRKAHPQGYQ
jgi:UDP-glucose 4-epimerase